MAMFEVSVELLPWLERKVVATGASFEEEEEARCASLFRTHFHPDAVWRVREPHTGRSWTARPSSQSVRVWLFEDRPA